MSYEYKKEFDNMVLTATGFKHASQLEIGDSVVEYGTNKVYQVTRIIQSKPCKCYVVTYNDRRHAIYHIDEKVYLGNRIVPVHDIVNSNIVMDFEQYPVIYGSDHNLYSPSLSPYITGALLTYGDWRLPYVCIPFGRPKIIPTLCNEHDLECEISKDGYVFKWKCAKSDDEFIKWIDIFPEHYFYYKRYKYIPHEYKYSSLKSRWQFIKGVFDIGYSSDEFIDIVGISHPSENMLLEIQDILWSLGIMSTVTFRVTPEQQASGITENYVLEILSKEVSTYPGLSYDINNIEYLINTDAELIKRPFNLQIMRVVDAFGFDQFSCNFETDKGIEMVYISDQYLPRISL